jgi:hypothetical protein
VILYLLSVQSANQTNTPFTFLSLEGFPPIQKYYEWKNPDVEYGFWKAATSL